MMELQVLHSACCDDSAHNGSSSAAGESGAYEMTPPFSRQFFHALRRCKDASWLSWNAATRVLGSYLQQNEGSGPRGAHTHHTSHVTRHTSHVTRHTSHVTHSKSFFTVFAATPRENDA